MALKPRILLLACAAVVVFSLACSWFIGSQAKEFTSGGNLTAPIDVAIMTMYSAAHAGDNASIVAAVNFAVENQGTTLFVEKYAPTEEVRTKCVLAERALIDLEKHIRSTNELILGFEYIPLAISNFPDVLSLEGKFKYVREGKLFLDCYTLLSSG